MKTCFRRRSCTDGHIGAAFREAVYIDGDQKVLLGRDSLESLGDI